MKSPVQYEVFVEKFTRGKWHKEIVNRKGEDFCAVIQNPAEPWYKLFKVFKKKECPFPPGHVEILKNEKLISNADFIPFTFIGKYRFTMKFGFVTDEGEVVDCTRLLVDVAEA